jgi:hypothetical protein
MKREKFSFSAFPRNLSVDTLTRLEKCGLSTLSHLLTGCRSQSVDTPRKMRAVNTSTLIFQGNTKNNFFHTSQALTDQALTDQALTETT